MDFFKKLFRRSPASSIPPAPQPAAKAPVKEAFEKERNRLAQLCKMGDTAAMYNLACLWLGEFSQEERLLIQRYEADPTPETLQPLQEYTRQFRGHSKFEYYTMWITRAAVYGHPKAKAILENCPYYKNKAYIPYKFYTASRTTEPFWSSDLFYKAGLCDIIRGVEDCGLSFHRDDGYFDFYYVSDYEPPDEEGFGSNSEYTSVFYDEFFRKIPVPSNATRQEILLGLQKVEASREAFWNAQADCSQRKYTASLKK